MKTQKIELKISVPGVKIAKDKVQAVRFRVLPKSQLIRATSLRQPPLYVEQLSPTSFVAGPKKELPVSARSPSEAFAKSVNRFWH